VFVEGVAKEKSWVDEATGQTRYETVYRVSTFTPIPKQNRVPATPDEQPDVNNPQ
jgi:hypothetical protein